jgi:hypothetical protein
MNTDKFALSSSEWPFNQLARQPVLPQRMGEGGSFLGRQSLRGGSGNGSSVFICADLRLNIRAPGRQIRLLAAFGRKNPMTADSRLLSYIPAYFCVRGKGLACRSIKSPIFLPNPSFCH